jgi:hypothetical protein
MYINPTKKRYQLGGDENNNRLGREFCERKNNKKKFLWEILTRPVYPSRKSVRGCPNFQTNLSVPLDGLSKKEKTF